jgi:peptidoglycan/LPS O-acetylase OafA/YrhL
MPPSSLRVPPVVFYVVWPLIYISLLYVAARSKPTRVAIAMYLALSLVWIGLAVSSSLAPPPASC